MSFQTKSAISVLLGAQIWLSAPALAADRPIEGMWNYRISEWSNGTQAPTPELTAFGAEQVAKAAAARKNGHTRSVANMKCLPIGFPGVMFYRTPIEILEGAKRVAIVAESAIEPRTVYLDKPHPEIIDPSWYGHSVGHWEGEDLVVDTIGLNGRANHHGIWNVGRNLPGSSEQAHIIERFHVEPDGKVLTLTMTVTDPVFYAKPYTVTVHYDRMPDDAERIEAVCEVDLNALANVDLEAIKDVDSEAARMLDPDLQYNPIESSN